VYFITVRHWCDRSAMSRKLRKYRNVDLLILNERKPSSAYDSTNWLVAALYAWLLPLLVNVFCIL